MVPVHGDARQVHGCKGREAHVHEGPQHRVPGLGQEGMYELRLFWGKGGGGERERENYRVQVILDCVVA